MTIWIQKQATNADAQPERQPVSARLEACAHVKATINHFVAEHILSVKSRFCPYFHTSFAEIKRFSLQVVFSKADVASMGVNGKLKLENSDWQMTIINLNLSLKMPCFVYLLTWTTFVTELPLGKDPM